MNTGWNKSAIEHAKDKIINLLGNEYWLEPMRGIDPRVFYYKPTGK